MRNIVRNIVQYNYNPYYLPENVPIQHHGIKGMKWGVRRFQKKDGSLTPDGEKRYREKLSKIVKNKYINESDRRRFEYRNQSLAKRAGKTAASGVAQMILSDVMTGNITRYASMNREQLIRSLTKKAITLTATTAANVAVNDALAKSASKRYTDDGKKIRGTKNNGLMTKEDAIETGVGIASRVVPVMNIALKMKASQVRAQRAKNEETFNRWGQNILSEKLDNVIWQSDDLKTAIIDNRKR